MKTLTIPLRRPISLPVTIGRTRVSARAAIDVAVVVTGLLLALAGFFAPEVTWILAHG